jgi:chromosome segregation ATPase
LFALPSVNQSFATVKRDLAESNSQLHERTAEGRAARRELAAAKEDLDAERKKHAGLHAQMETLFEHRHLLNEQVAQRMDAIRLLEGSIVQGVSGRLQSLTGAVASEESAHRALHDSPALNYLEEQLDFARAESNILRGYTTT